jgi:hypothetical protein
MTEPQPSGNPFAVRHIQPGAAPYLFADGLDAGGLVRRFARLGWRGAVIGPHGSGKSTLLASFLPALIAAGRRPLSIVLHDGRRTLPAAAWRALRGLAQGAVVVIDGYEQFGWLARMRVRWLCSRGGYGLLATAHGPVGLPVLLRTEVAPSVARRLIEQLRPGLPAPSDAELSARLRRRRGNFREVLFDMYDECERARRQDRWQAGPSQLA